MYRSLLFRNNDFLPSQRRPDWVWIREDIIDLFQRPSLGLDKEEINEDNPDEVYHEVEEVELLRHVSKTFNMQ